MRPALSAPLFSSAVSLGAAALICVLTACASGPTKKRPTETAASRVAEIGIPAEWSAGREIPRDAVPASTPWWTRFDDPDLDALVAEGLSANPSLQQAAAAYDTARATARIARAEQTPKVEAGASAESRQQVFVGLPIPGLDGPLRTTSDAFSLALTVSWEADLWGRVRAGRRAATSDAAASGAELTAARLSVAAQISRAWFTTLESARQVDLAERTTQSRRDTVERVEARYLSGVGAPLDLRLARAAAARAEGVEAQRRRRLDAAQRTLESLLGRYPAGRIESAGELAAPTGSLPSAMPTELVTRRPDLAAAERRLVAAGWRVVEARRALYPRLAFRAGGGTLSDAVGDLLDGDFSIWNLAGSLLQPLFQGGRLRAALSFAEASRERALAEYAERVLQAFAEVETALAAERLLVAEANALEIAAEEARAAARLAEERYLAGLGDYLDLLESQRQISAAESALLAVRRQHLTNRVDLYTALGGDAFP